MSFKTRGFGRVEIRDLELNIDIYSDVAGEVNGNKLVLKKMDSIDVDVEFEIKPDEYSDRRVSLKGDRAWELLKTIVDNTVSKPELVKRIVETHKVD